METAKRISLQNLRGDCVRLTIPRKPEYVSVARMGVAAAVSRWGLDIEEIEDLKVAVAEACSSAINCGQHGKEDTIEVVCLCGTDEISITVANCGMEMNSRKTETPDLDLLSEESSLGIFIIESLVDKVEFSVDEEKGTLITMVKYTCTGGEE